MRVLNGRFLAPVFLLLLAAPREAISEIVYTFENSGIFENDGAGDTATFPDPDTQSGIVGTITTIEVVQADGSTGGTLNENSGSLGVNNLDEADDRFQELESWTFSWDVDTTLDFIDFEALTDDELFLLHSPDWIGKGFTSSVDELTFDSDGGEFTFADNGGDRFDLTSIITGDPLLVSANTPYRLAFDEGEKGSNAGIDAFTFSASATAVPEPVSAVALLGLAGAIAARRWHRNFVRKTLSG